ncbi:right-handed parallel beta-helix repeat-containing protein [Halobacteria archaeon HArc-gm2]|nr:right-handed parallel beta-helix repeat-containing protein [Halobacteria archaeon HArc-gm2]
MSLSTKPVAVLVAFAVCVSGTAVLATGPASAQTSSIDSCTVIDQPGYYVLTEDIDLPNQGHVVGLDERACIDIRANDVILDGDGHVVDSGRFTKAVGTGNSMPVRNVTVTDLEGTDNVVNVRFENVTDGRITNVTSLDPNSYGEGVQIVQSKRVEIRESELHNTYHAGYAAVRISDTTNATVSNNTFSATSLGVEAERLSDSVVKRNSFDVKQFGSAISVESGSGNLLAENVVAGRPNHGILLNGHENTVAENTIRRADDTGIDVDGSGHTVSNNDVSRAAEWGALVEGSNHTIVKNEFSRGGDGSDYGGALRLAGDDHVVASNDLGGVHGVFVRRATGQTTIRHNDIDATYGVRIANEDRCRSRWTRAAFVDVRANNFTVSDGDRQAYAVVNEDEQVVTATNNYWGAETGPSSPAGENVTDPMTSTAADGDGAPVSSGVHFDPWLPQEPTNGTAG